jgi:uncharacterized OB-fold protein
VTGERNLENPPPARVDHERTTAVPVDGWLLPDTDDPDTAGFWAACREGRLVVQACADCGARRMPPRPMCPRCRSLAVRWDEVSGRGRIWSFCVPHPPLLPAYAAVAPYNAVIVELEDDPAIRLVGNLVTGPDGALNGVDPASIRIGEPVEVVFSPVTDDVTLPRWRRPSPPVA